MPAGIAEDRMNPLVFEPDSNPKKAFSVFLSQICILNHFFKKKDKKKDKNFNLN